MKGQKVVKSSEPGFDLQTCFNQETNEGYIKD